MTRQTSAVLVVLVLATAACASDVPTTAAPRRSTTTTTTSSTVTAATIPPTPPTVSAKPQQAAAPAEATRCPGIDANALDRFAILTVENSAADSLYVLCDRRGELMTESRGSTMPTHFVLGDDPGGSTSVLFGGRVDGGWYSFGQYRFDADRVVVVDDFELQRESRSLRCDGDAVVIRDFELPSSLRDPVMQWTETRSGVVTDSGTLHVRADYREVAEVATSFCRDWTSSPMFGVAAFTMGLLLKELQFAEMGGDHSIDPTSSAAGVYDGQQYEVHIDLEFQDEYFVGGGWIRDCEIGRLSVSPAPSPDLLADLVDFAGCPA